MNFLTFFLVPLFSLALPASAQTNQCTGDKSIPGHCTILSMTDVTSSTTNPPTLSECQNTCRNTLTDAGDWLVDFTGKPTGYIDTLSQSACGFSVGRAVGSTEMDFKFYMHNQDIVDAIDDASQRYGGSHGGKVAAEGTMNCDGHLATWYVN